MTKRMIGMCLISAALVGGVAAAGQAATGRGHSHGEGGPLRALMSGQFGRLLTLRSELDLTTEQKESIHKIVANHRQEIVTVMKPVAEKRRALREATIATNPDEKAIRAAASDLGNAMGDAAVLGSKIKAEVVTVLTPEQKQKVDEFRKHADAAVDHFFQETASDS
jgi:Spy/CpxP family protein refolding chaperone